ncbi:MAG TPA: hypothetical protein VL422_18235, partial [Miltoncostaea sp.]|nr:hypothetical protein [Miltoncostaea sp.]
MAVAVVVVAAAVAVVLARRGGDATTGWSDPEALPAPPDARATAVAVDGTVLAVWTDERRGETAVRSSSLADDGTWSEPVTIQAPQTWDGSYPTAAIGPGGDAVAVWSWYAR